MIDDTKANYLRIALGLSGIVVSEFTSEIICRTLKSIEEKKGAFSISDSVEITHEVEKMFEEKQLKFKQEKHSKKEKSHSAKRVKTRTKFSKHKQPKKDSASRKISRKVNFIDDGKRND